MHNNVHAIIALYRYKVIVYRTFWQYRR